MLSGRDWFKNEGASEEAMGQLTKTAPCALPKGYVALLRYSNGGEGPLPVDPWNFCLDPAEQAAATEQIGALKEFFPNLFVFGTSGGGDAIAFDVSASEPYRVVQFDMTNCDLAESVRDVAPSFDAFLDLVGRAGV